MNTSDFDYNLPPELIAQQPVRPRDSSRLMIVERNKEQGTRNKRVEHRHFFDIVDYLQKGDLIVWNNSKVFKARLFGQLVSSTGRVLRGEDKPVEVLLIKPMENEGVWKVLARPGKHVKLGTKVIFAKDFYCEPIITEKDGSILVQFPVSVPKGTAPGKAFYSEEEVRKKANQYGAVPVPPYIKDEKHELESYQTVYASDKKEGSVAAPTAGFHFTPELIKKLKDKGVEFAEVTLHVGLGTFLPVKSERIEDHVMHSEWVELSRENAEKINRAKKEGRRVVAVGTTTVRTLEGIAQLLRNTYHVTCNKKKCGKNLLCDTCYVVREYQGEINIFITPGFQFKVVDALITNFHLPKSTLLMLVCVFAGSRKFVLNCYQEAVEQKYRFYSFGDAMFIS